ncbi:Dynein light chain [Paragonimus heterotremus]|uniref:Dynein light chain n=1 Tax=Paragonimus heterotremus TaxID=100268 RepID=A0A8J4SLP7_9TREM|nr:Dynein light chain [Paragonimus heterotremus]
MIYRNPEQKPMVKNADMPDQMQQYAIHLCEEAMDRCTLEKDVAACLKKEMDKRYGPTWHCIVGRNFGSYVTHEAKNFLYFYMGQSSVLLFKSG